jgi:hypothetical protein
MADWKEDKPMKAKSDDRDALAWDEINVLI